MMYVHPSLDYGSFFSIAGFVPCFLEMNTDMWQSQEFLSPELRVDTLFIQIQKKKNMFCEPYMCQHD